MDYIIIYRPVTVKCTEKFIKIVLIQSGFERDERS